MDRLGHAAIGQLSWVPVAAESEAGRNLEWRIGTRRDPISINPHTDGARAGSRTLNLGIKSPLLVVDSQDDSQVGERWGTTADSDGIGRPLIVLQWTLLDSHGGWTRGLQNRLWGRCCGVPGEFHFSSIPVKCCGQLPWRALYLGPRRRTVDDASSAHLTGPNRTSTTIRLRGPANIQPVRSAIHSAASGCRQGLRGRALTLVHRRHRRNPESSRRPAGLSPFRR
jgi:hypothetical protein